ncbi:MAG TPA: DUF420 domain-containing protein [Candidatus Bathyarchaeia archaeon]|nr:DUF420 domain-containing protein [Candidatus Bathyarchaeia archaeon]
MSEVLPLTALPTLNAVLNAASAALLLTGYRLIRRRRVAAHRACMLAALVTSSVFLTSYLYYHAHVGSVHYTGEGWLRPTYFTILTTHTLLAASVPPLALRTFYLAWKGQIARHRRIARWTWPIWMYVSVTGVVVYLMLYRLPKSL